MSLDWPAMFGVQLPLLEIVIRGTAIYWFLFVLFRFVIRRDVGSVGLADLLLLVIVADAAQNALAGEYRSITEGVVLISVIAGWNLLVDALAYHYSWVDRLARPRLLPLVRHGQVQRANMARELLTIDDLMSKLRQQGVEDLKEVKHAYMEPGGDISVIRQGR